MCVGATLADSGKRPLAGDGHQGVGLATAPVLLLDEGTEPSCSDSCFCVFWLGILFEAMAAAAWDCPLSTMEKRQRRTAADLDAPKRVEGRTTEIRHRLRDQ